METTMKTPQYKFTTEIGKALKKNGHHKIKKSLLFRDNKAYKLLIKEVKVQRWTLTQDNKYFYVTA